MARSLRRGDRERRARVVDDFGKAWSPFSRQGLGSDVSAASSPEDGKAASVDETHLRYVSSQYEVCHAEPATTSTEEGGNNDSSGSGSRNNVHRHERPRQGWDIVT